MSGPRITPTATSKPVNERVTGYPYSPFINDVGIEYTWEPAGMGDPWPGVWIVTHLPDRYRNHHA